MTTHQIIGLLAVLIGAAGIVHYYIGIFKGKVKPHAFTWMIWALTTWIIGLAQYIDGGGVGAYVTILSGAVATCTMCLALKFGDRKNITRSDWVSFIVALLTISLWYMTHTPLYTVLLLVLIDLFGFYPSFRKGYQRPWDEGTFLFGAVSVKFLLTFFALENVTLITALYPIVLFVINAVFAGMLILRRQRVVKPV